MKKYIYIIIILLVVFSFSINVNAETKNHSNINLKGSVTSNISDDYKLYQNFQEVGTYSKQFDASNLSAGIYLYKLQVNNFTSVKRMTLIK